MTDRLFDAGVNLANSQFDSDLEEVLQRARAAGVTGLIAIGCDLLESRRCQHLSKRLAQYNIHATAGIHPHYADGACEKSLTELEALIALPSTIAVGETGLDFNRNFSAPELQRKAFDAQLEMACRHCKPVYLHERDAFDEQVAMLRSKKDRLHGGVAHCFTGSAAQAKAYLDLDLYIGITGWVCDPKRGKDLREALSSIPLERIILETDAPYLLPRNIVPQQLPTERKRRNEPALLSHIANYIAQLLEEDPVRIAQTTLRNTRELFRL